MSYSASDFVDDVLEGVRRLQVVPAEHVEQAEGDLRQQADLIIDCLTRLRTAEELLRAAQVELIGGVRGRSGKLFQRVEAYLLGADEPGTSDSARLR